MKLKGFVVIVTLFALHTTAFSADVFTGTWKTNIEQSQFSPGPILKPSGPNFTRIESVQDGFKFVSDGVDGKGRKTHGEYTATFDGRDSFYTQVVDGQADPDSAPSTVSLTKVDDRTLELTFKAAGRVVLVTKLVISPDGKGGTATSTGFNVDGSTSISTVFYDRQ